MYNNSGICDTKTSDISETKRSRTKLTTECLQKLVYGLSIGDKMNLVTIAWTTAYFSREQNFSQRISRTLFVGARRNLAALVPRGLANRNLFPEFRKFWFGDWGYHDIPCGDMHQSFTDTFVKWLFDSFRMFAHSFSVVSIHCVVRGLGASFLYRCPASRASSLRQHSLLVEKVVVWLHCDTTSTRYYF